MSGTAGSAKCEVSYSTGGIHDITAVYSGDENFAGSTSSPSETITVQPWPLVESPTPGGSTTGGGGGTGVQQVVGEGSGTSSGEQSIVIAVSSAGGGVAKTPASSRVLLVNGSVTVHGGSAVVRLRCSGAHACVGRAVLRARRPGGSGHGKAVRKTRVTLGAAGYSVPAGTVRSVRIRLTAAGLAMLRADRTLKTELKFVRAS